METGQLPHRDVAEWMFTFLQVKGSSLSAGVLFPAKSDAFLSPSNEVKQL